MPTGQIDVRQYIGKRVYAKKSTPIYRAAFDDQKPVFTVAPGAEIGICYSFLDPRSGRSVTWLMFYDSNQRPYYCPLDDKIDLQKIVDQGAKDDKTVTKEKADAGKTGGEKFWDKLSQTGKTAVNILGLAAVIYGIHKYSEQQTRKPATR